MIITTTEFCVQETMQDNFALSTLQQELHLPDKLFVIQYAFLHCKKDAHVNFGNLLQRTTYEALYNLAYYRYIW